MNIVMHAPGLRRSAIGRMAAMVSRELVQLGHEVTIARSEARQYLKEESHDFRCRQVDWTNLDQLADYHRSADIVIYHIGDNLDYHQGAIEWSEKIRGIVCLHDLYLGNLFIRWCIDNQEMGRKTFETLYDNISFEDFNYFSTLPEFIEKTRTQSPMTEWICSRAEAVITHSNWDIGRVLSSCPGPVRVVPLAYDTVGVSKSNVEPSTGGLRILTIGQVNPNKRIDKVIEAIAGDERLRGSTSYRVVGEVEADTAARLTRLSSERHADVTLTGAVDDASLVEEFAGADVVICLRWPVLEAASASAIESMFHGKAVVVTNTGFYAELPDDVVFKINLENEQAELQAVLKRFLEDPFLAPKVGKKAKEWAKRTFTAANYTQNIVEIADDLLASRPAMEAIFNNVTIAGSWGASTDLLQAAGLVNKMECFRSEVN